MAAGAGLLILAAGGAATLFIDHRVEGLLDADTRQELATEQAVLCDILRDDGPAGLTGSVIRLIRERRNPDAIYWLDAGPTGPVIGNLAEPPPDAVLQGTTGRFAITRDGLRQQVLASSILLPEGGVLLIGRTESARAGLRQALLEAFIATLALVGLTALGLGLFLEQLLRRKVDMIAQTASGIVAGDLARRVPASGRGDEFDRLAHVLNAMLDRLDQQVGTMRAVTDSLAHDMRLPLTRIRAGLEAVAATDDPAVRAAALERTSVQTEQALSTFNTLLDIARADAGVGRDAFGPVDLAAVATDVAELFDPIAEEAGYPLRLKVESADLWGQGGLLRQALGNLVHNAIKYAGSAAPIEIEVRQQDSLCILEVRDHGPGISGDQHERALRPFGRLERDGDIDGTGLGLALAAACARLHGGRLVLDDNRPGLIARIELPAVPHRRPAAS